MFTNSTQCAQREGSRLRGSTVLLRLLIAVPLADCGRGVACGPGTELRDGLCVPLTSHDAATVSEAAVDANRGDAAQEVGLADVGLADARLLDASDTDEGIADVQLQDESARDAPADRVVVDASSS